MKAFFKSKATFRKLASSADVLSASICLASSDEQDSSITAVGEFARSMSDQWLIYDNRLYLISRVTPQDGRTLFTMSDPIMAFDRKIAYSAPASGFSSGAFLAREITANWINQEDSDYAIPYLVVLNSDSGDFLEPTVDDNGMFSLPEYIRMLEYLKNIRINFSFNLDTLTMSISRGSTTARRIRFNNGHNQLISAAYSKSGLAKLTVVQPQDSGQVDADGNAIMVNVATNFYLAEDGSVSSSIPGRRAKGEWDTIFISEKQDALTKAQETFAKNKNSHKIEFYSDRELDVFDPCDVSLYGETLSSYISYKGRVSTDDRYIYRTGELATTASEKLKGVTRSR